MEHSNGMLSRACSSDLGHSTPLHSELSLTTQCEDFSVRSSHRRQVPKKFNAFETPGPGRYDGTLNRTGDASFTKNTSSPSFGFGSGTYADGPKRYAAFYLSPNPPPPKKQQKPLLFVTSLVGWTRDFTRCTIRNQKAHDSTHSTPAMEGLSR